MEDNLIRDARDPVRDEINRLRSARGIGSDQALPPLVADSWRRCLADHNLRPDEVPRAAVLTHAEINHLSQAHEDLLSAAGPEVEKLFLQLVDSEYLVSFASLQGVMLLFRVDYQYLSDMTASGVLPGSVWTEEQQGTNGVGTCLRVGKPVTIIRNQHYGVATQCFTCITAPVVGGAGAMEGVLNVTTTRQGDDRTNRMVQNILSQSARRIEARHFGRRHRRSLLLRISEDVESGDLADEARIALDDSWRVLEGTTQVSSLTGSPLERMVGALADEVFDMGIPLRDVRPERPFRFAFNGKTFQGVLSLPETRSLASRLNTGEKQSRPFSLYGPSNSVAGPAQLYIDPTTAAAIQKGQKLLEAGLPLVVTGESGTGKSAFAETVARRCVGNDGSLIFVDCAAVTTGASAGAVFHDEIMQTQGCLILDRFDELSDAGQNALLSLLDSDRRRDGHGMGVMAISEADLDEVSKTGKLRAGLLHRLKGGAITLRPLRADPNLDETMQQLLRIELAALGKDSLKLDDEAKLILRHYHWPGNHRELRNALRHAAVLADRKTIRLEHLPENIVSQIARKDLTARSQSEAARIEAALRHNGGNLSLTARYLGVSRATLYRKIHIQKVRDQE